MPILPAIFHSRPPLSLYVHIPWCVRKCPYCDFNSHVAPNNLPETLYVNALLQELAQHAALLQDRPLYSIFFGGGTPSLFSGDAIARILNGIAGITTLPADIEITLEANPGTIDQARFQDFRAAGVNRLSIGIQSFDNEKLKALGRIHDRDHALAAIDYARAAGFNNFNLDLMYGLPQQTTADALLDLQTAIACEPTHLSWYQLTIEPNTLFYQQTPALPLDETIFAMQQAGHALLIAHGLQQYEVSAYSRLHHHCQHNRNYWEFGDYLGIGAGAHSKITDQKESAVLRFAQVKHPRDYLNINERPLPQQKKLHADDLMFEFMLNALRLSNGVPTTLFTERTGLPLTQIETRLHEAKRRGLLSDEPTRLVATDLGKRFLNDLVGMFL